MFVGLEEGANLDLVGSLYIGVCFRTVMLRGGNWQSSPPILLRIFLHSMPLCSTNSYNTAAS